MGITGMVTTVTDVLNIWNDYGVFSYVIPFLLIFAVIFAILDKTKILGKDNRGIQGIVAASIGLLSLQVDFVSEFFAVIFPRFGIGIAIFIVLIIMIGFFLPDGDLSKMNWIGYVVGIGVVLWAITSWDQWSSYNGFGGWFSQNIWAIIILAVLVAVILFVIKKPSTGSSPKG